MCYDYDCPKYFKGWFKSFTKTEILLAILEAILLIVCIAFLIFLVMHLIVCESKCSDKDIHRNVTTKYPSHITSPEYFTSTGHHGSVTRPGSGTGVHTSTTPRPLHTHDGSTCTWQPSKKTPAATHYYDVEKRSTDSAEAESPEPPPATYHNYEPVEPSAVDELARDDQSDGEEAGGELSALLLALVKPRPPDGVTFGCALTALSSRWAVTAASCLEAIEEVDSLDNFVMVEGYGGGGGGRVRAVSDVQVHPQYGGANRSYDVAALRAEARLGAPPARLPDLVDYFLITVGERLTVLGFGPFRSIAGTNRSMSARAAHVYAVPGALCGRGGRGGWAARHLGAGRALRLAACGAAALCAGPLYARGAPCNYCAGSPLLRARTLLGVMADARQCGVACEPASYVNIAVVRDWLEMVIEPD